MLTGAGGLIAAFWLTLVVLLADVTICIHGSQAQQVPGPFIESSWCFFGF